LHVLQTAVFVNSFRILFFSFPLHTSTHTFVHTHARTHTHLFIPRLFVSKKRIFKLQEWKETQNEASNAVCVSVKVSLDVAAYSPITSGVLSILCRSVIGNRPPASFSGHTACSLIRTLVHLAEFSKRYYRFSFRGDILFWKSYGARREKNTEC